MVLKNWFSLKLSNRERITNHDIVAEGLPWDAGCRHGMPSCYRLRASRGLTLSSLLLNSPRSCQLSSSSVIDSAGSRTPLLTAAAVAAVVVVLVANEFWLAAV